MQILLADDSKTNLALTAAALNNLGHEVIAVNSGVEAIEAFKKSRPDLIILDVVMQGLSGFECAKKIREISSDDWIPIIFLSASVDDESIAKGIAAGGDDYLTKPFSEITLAAKIKAMQRIAEMRERLYKTTQELLVLSSTDALTGVYNRHQFEKTIREKLAEADRHHLNLAVLFIDLDHFKTINDTIGHHVGDLMLKEVATRIKDCIREEDFIARIGGDEFVVIASHLNKANEDESISQLAQRIIDAVSESYTLEGNHFRIGASIGVAYYPSEGTNRESLVKNADVAMYHAKELGRNNFQVYRPELDERYKKQIGLEHDLRFALSRNEFFIVYQPIYNILTHKIVSIEALLRWRHPEIGIVSPNVFIPIAEEHGLIVDMGNWVLENVCAQAAKWYYMGFKNIRYSLNLSLHQFLQDNFIDQVNSSLEKVKLPANLLELELTESKIITFIPNLKEIMKRLRNTGVGVAIDDFGTRYSFLTSMGALPISTLKIDRAFLKDVTVDAKNNIIVKSLIALGRNLGLNVIAEGVQSEEQLQFLIVNGCLQAQGFYFDKPMTADKMTEILLSEEDKKSMTEYDEEEHE